MLQPRMAEENPMETVGQVVGKIETRLRQLGTRLDRLVAKADEAGTEAKNEHRQRLTHIKDKLAVVRSKLDAFRAAHGRRWDDFRGGIETAWHDLENALQALKQ
jgi:hypothetical protein